MHPRASPASGPPAYGELRGGGLPLLCHACRVPALKLMVRGAGHSAGVAGHQAQCCVSGTALTLPLLSSHAGLPLQDCGPGGPADHALHRTGRQRGGAQVGRQQMRPHGACLILACKRKQSAMLRCRQRAGQRALLIFWLGSFLTRPCVCPRPFPAPAQLVPRVV